MADNKFSQLGRVEAIRQLFEGTGYTAFEEPCWFETGKGEYVTTASRLLLEGIDFNLVYFPYKHLGYKSVISVTGELYAVMSRPRTLSVVLGISAKSGFDQVKELWSGVVFAAREHGYKSVSLDLQPSQTGLSISVSATGVTSKDVKRPEAGSKDLICVSGSLGAAYLGLQVLERKPSELEAYKMMVGSYLKPELSPLTLKQLNDDGICPSYGYFVTRGLSDAIKRLSRDSGLGAKIYADKIPFEGNSFSLGKELDIDPVSAAMNGGDDYRLLFVIPILEFEKFRKDFQTFDIIGHLAQPEVGTVLVTPDGVELSITAQGWNEE
ncbi:MAG: thiamine-phosphate kinase [Bacteroidales bacterium]|nr:thiamine-phosphate kinase [Bacteroidales bacterium]